MLALIFFYLVLPFLIFAVLLKLLRRYAPDTVPPEIRAYCAERPVPKDFYRALRMDGTQGHGASCASLGDFEKQDDALETAFSAKASHQGDPAAFLILNDKGEVLRQL